MTRHDPSGELFCWFMSFVAASATLIAVIMFGFIILAMVSKWPAMVIVLPVLAALTVRLHDMT